MSDCMVGVVDLSLSVHICVWFCLFLSSVFYFLPFMLYVLDFFDGWWILIKCSKTIDVHKTKVTIITSPKMLKSSALEYTQKLNVERHQGEAALNCDRFCHV